MKVYLTTSKDGRILVQGRITEGTIISYLLHYVSQGESFNGVSYDDFAKSSPGPMELPEQPNLMNVTPDTAQVEQPQGLSGPQG